MQAATSKIQEQGNTTIPQSVRDYLKLDTGASIVYTYQHFQADKDNRKVEIQKQIDAIQKLRDERREQASSRYSSFDNPYDISSRHYSSYYNPDDIHIGYNSDIDSDSDIDVEKATSKIQEQGNTTIPQSVRDYLELDRGASIVYTFDPNGKVEIQKQDRFNAIDLSIDGDDNTIS